MGDFLPHPSDKKYSKFRNWRVDISQSKLLNWIIRSTVVQWKCVHLSSWSSAFQCWPSSQVFSIIF